MFSYRDSKFSQPEIQAAVILTSKGNSNKVTLIYDDFLGKAIGGRKAKENRLRIKHLTSGQYSSSFHGDLNVAVSKILTEKERFVDKNKEKRKVIKEQTKETRTSMAKSIVLGKVILPPISQSL